MPGDGYQRYNEERASARERLAMNGRSVRVVLRTLYLERCENNHHVYAATSYAAAKGARPQVSSLGLRAFGHITVSTVVRHLSLGRSLRRRAGAER